MSRVGAQKLADAFKKRFERFVDGDAAHKQPLLSDSNLYTVAFVYASGFESGIKYLLSDKDGLPTPDDVKRAGALVVNWLEHKIASKKGGKVNKKAR